jgi:hypothetical protein
MKKAIQKIENHYYCDGCGTDLGTCSGWKCNKCGGDIGVCCAITVKITKWKNPEFKTGTQPETIEKRYHPKCWNDLDKKLP